MDGLHQQPGLRRIGCVTDTNLVESPGKDQQIMVSVAVERLAPLTLDGATRIPDGVGKPAALKSKVAERVGDESKLNATLLGLRGWRKPVFTTDDVEGERVFRARRTVLEMLRDDQTLFGLGDGGAHCGLICDATIPTYLLTHWVRDRKRGERLPLEE